LSKIIKLAAHLQARIYFSMNLSDLRRDFGKDRPKEIFWPETPYMLFSEWMQEAISASIIEANAMVLSTCSNHGSPSSRVVLLKEFSVEEGFVFYTHYKSRKGMALEENPHASLHFFWREMERQVSMEGVVRKTSARKSDAYFFSRPLESQLSALLSPQSQPIESLEEIKAQWHHLKKHPPKAVIRPKNWGGYRLLPARIEFWQGGIHRLHQRMVYTAETSGWTRSQLAP
jgi:pyridoxamine 5'-phosphate oxidase